MSLYHGEAPPLCSDCPPVGYPTDRTRCAPCPRRGGPPMTTAPTQVGQSALLNVQVHDEQNPRKSPRGEA